jgi:hypothetical protein
MPSRKRQLKLDQRRALELLALKPDQMTLLDR